MHAMGWLSTLTLWLRTRVHPAGEEETGSSTLETVIIAAVLSAAAIAAGAVIVAAIVSHSNAIK